MVLTYMVLTLIANVVADPALSLIQQRAVKVELKKVALPNVSEVLQQPSQAFDLLSSKLSSLQGRLAEMNHQGLDALRAQNAEYEKQLDEQRTQNAAIRQANEKLSSEISALNKANAHRRKNVESLERVTKQQLTEVQGLRDNISTAQEFTDSVLANAQEIRKENSELRVLFELDEEEAAQHVASAHLSRLSELAAAKLAMLQTVAGSSRDDVEPQDVLHSLTSAINQLSTDQNASMSSLKESFMKEFKKGEDLHEELTKEQATLNATKTSALELQEKLQIAEAHLTKTRQQLAEKGNALRLFAQRLSRVASDSISLLQVAPSKALPEMSTVLAQPEHVFKAMNSQISALEAGLAEVRDQNMEAVQHQKSEYEQTLKSQLNENRETEKTNAALAREIQELNDENTHLRSQANKLSDDNSLLTADLHILEANLSTAQEFTEEALRSSDSMLNVTSPELNILAELEERDKKEADERAHLQHLKEVDRVAFMQMGASRSKPLRQPSDLLQSLISKLNEFSEQANLSQQALKEEFEKELKKGDERHQDLLSQQADLNATRQSAKELKERLFVAVEHLTKRNGELVQRRLSLKDFMKRLGPSQKESPVSLLQVAKDDSAGIPNVAQTVHERTKEYKAMNKDVDALDSRLAHVQDQTSSVLSKQRTIFQEKLQLQKTKILAAQAVNANLSAAIKELHKVRSVLRKNASVLEAGNNALRRELAALQANFSTAEDFADLALSTAPKKLYDDSDLQILHELDNEKASAGVNLSHNNSRKNIALLSYGATVTSDPQEMLNALVSSIDDLAKEQNEGVAALQESFYKESNASEARYKDVLKKQAVLTATMLSENEVNDKLALAVSNLQDTKNHLKKDIDSIRSYVAKLSSFSSSPSRPSAPEKTMEKTKEEAKLSKHHKASSKEKEQVLTKKEAKPSKHHEASSKTKEQSLKENLMAKWKRAKLAKTARSKKAASMNKTSKSVVNLMSMTEKRIVATEAGAKALADNYAQEAILQQKVAKSAAEKQVEAEKKKGKKDKHAVEKQVKADKKKAKKDENDAKEEKADKKETKKDENEAEEEEADAALQAAAASTRKASWIEWLLR